MNNVYIEADGIRLDTYDDISISLNYAIEDILDITKRNTSYSKTLTLPGTPKNNQFFNQIFDVNIDSISFNPASSIPAVIRVDDNSVMDGILQLLNVIIVNGSVEYEVIVKGKLGGILSNMSDYSLTDIDLSEYNHIRNQQNIYGSWFYQVVKNGTLTPFYGPGEGYVYPYIVRGFLQNGILDMYTHQQFPAVYVKTIMDKIFEFSNYTYTSDFFNSDYFKKLIIPFTNDKLQLSDEEVLNRSAIIGVRGAPYNTSTGLVPARPEYPGGPVTGYVSMFNTTQGYYAGLGWINNSSSSYFIPLDREGGTVGNLDFSDNSNQWTTNTNFTCQEAGYYTFEMDIKLFAKYFSSTGGFFRYNGTDTWKYFYRVRKINSNGTHTILYTSTFPFEVAPSDNNDHNNPWYDLANPLTMAANIPNVYMEVGERFVIEIAINYTLGTNQWAVQSGPDDVGVRLVAKESFDGQPSFIKIYPSSNTAYADEEVNMNQILPNLKMKDVFLNIVKMFNLIVQDNPNKTNDLIIEPRDVYFDSKKKILDWNPIIDNDSEIKITPMSELDARSYVFTYKEDTDFYNEQYTEETKEIYGSLRIDVENDFSDKENKLELIFSPTPDSSLFIGPVVAPFFAKSEDGQTFTPQTVKPRILFYGGALQNDYTIRIIDYPNQNTPDVIFTSSYPYCGMFDNPYNPSYDLGFGRTKKIYWPVSQIPVNNLYEQFHKSTINNIIDINSRLLEAKFHLTPKDIAEFDFRDIVFLNGQYWRVNKIKDFNPAGADDLTTVILYKIVDIDFYKDGSVQLPTSNVSCPLDIVAKLIKGRYFYVSLSGQFISEDCCKELGGIYTDGRCRVRKKPILVGNPVKPIKFKYGGSDIVPISEGNGPVVLTKNNNSIKSPFVRVDGYNNYVAPNASGMIVGDDNSINEDVKNVFILGDNKNANQSDSIYFGDVIINPDGTIIGNGLKIIDNGEDVVFPFFKTNPIDIIDGTVDSVRNFGGFSKTRLYINGNNEEDLQLPED